MSAQAQSVPPGGSNVRPSAPTVIDCDDCTVRGPGCPDCFVTVLLGGPPEAVDLDDDSRRALQVLAAADLVPPLRMTPATQHRPQH